jgi:hypothetical protein
MMDGSIDAIRSLNNNDEEEPVLTGQLAVADTISRRKKEESDGEKPWKMM